MRKLIVSALVLAFVAPSIARADGESDYKAQCARCHGADAKGNAKLATALKVDPAKLNLSAGKMTEAEQVAITAKGKDKMPAFDKKLSKEQIDAIIKHSMALAKK